MSLGAGPVSIVGLIFGGCCSNVFALEALIRREPSSGLIITFTQVYLVSLAAYPTQFSSSGKYCLRKPTVPWSRWAYIAAMFFSINMLNNWAFAYHISVPVHIILRSFGSVSTMIAGVIRGKKYSSLQVLSVVVLTIGVLISAWADAQSKGKTKSRSSSYTSSSDFVSGLTILSLAQVLSAYSGTYVEDTYAQFRPSWTENMFYSHLLSLPLFTPLLPVCWQQYNKLSDTAPLDFKSAFQFGSTSFLDMASRRVLQFVQPFVQSLPQGLLFLFINALTQLACISGVNSLSSKSSAVTVTIVLNIRKLVSFIFSTILFGHKLSGLMILGATLVFGSGALYGWETSWRLPQQRKKSQAMNGSVKKNK